jgi:hypothetical protein
MSIFEYNENDNSKLIYLPTVYCTGTSVRNFHGYLKAVEVTTEKMRAFDTTEIMTHKKQFT